MKRTVALLTCLALLIPGASVSLASGSGSTHCSYTHNCHLKQVDHATASRHPAGASKSGRPSTVNDANATQTASTGSLPFTGLDVGALGAGAIVLLGAGVALRRVASDRR